MACGHRNWRAGAGSETELDANLAGHHVHSPAPTVSGLGNGFHFEQAEGFELLDVTADHDGISSQTPSEFIDGNEAAVLAYRFEECITQGCKSTEQAFGSLEAQSNGCRLRFGALLRDGRLPDSTKDRLLGGDFDDHARIFVSEDCGFRDGHRNGSSSGHVNSLCRIDT